MVVTSCISVQNLWKYGFAKFSENLYAPCTTKNNLLSFNVCTDTARRLHVVGILSYRLDNPEFDSKQLQETITFPEYPYRLWSPRSLLFEYYRRLSRQENADHVKSDHSSPAGGLRITAATSLLVLNTFTACTGTALPLPLSWWHKLPTVSRQRQRIFLWGPSSFWVVSGMFPTSSSGDRLTGSVT